MRCTFSPFGPGDPIGPWGPWWPYGNIYVELDNYNRPVDLTCEENAVMMMYDDSVFTSYPARPVSPCWPIRPGAPWEEPTLYLQSGLMQYIVDYNWLGEEVLSKVTVTLYHMSNGSSGPLLPNKTRWSSFPHTSSLSKVAKLTFGTLYTIMVYNITQNYFFLGLINDATNKLN